jgi:hypothetical protein
MLFDVQYGCSLYHAGESTPMSSARRDGRYFTIHAPGVDVARGIWLRKHVQHCRKSHEAVPRCTTPCTPLVQWVMSPFFLVEWLSLGGLDAGWSTTRQTSVQQEDVEAQILGVWSSRQLDQPKPKTNFEARLVLGAVD